VPEAKPDIEAMEKRLLEKQLLMGDAAPVENPMERLERLTGINPCRCPVCKTGRMVSVRTLPRIRSPGGMRTMGAVTASMGSSPVMI